MGNILFFYYKQSDHENVDVLKNVLVEYQFDSTNSLDEALKLIEEKTYEIIIVDFSKNLGKDLLAHIVKYSPDQKIITMSDNLECSVLQGCEHCMHTLQRKRVFKPLNLKELMRTIKNYDEMICHYMHKFNNIIEILEEIIHSKYNHFEYDETQQLIFPKEKFAESLIIEEIVHITELLQKNEIPYKVNENYTIKLLT